MIDPIEVRGYLYRFTIGIDETVYYECEDCGALVSFMSIKKHDHFHSAFNVLASTSGLA